MRPQPSTEHGSELRPVRVLVVDDHRLVREGLRAHLALSGFDVSEAATGAAAIVAASQQDFDVVLLDLSLPDLPGATVCAALRRRAPGTAVAILSAYGDRGSVEEALEAGATAYLLKDAEDLDLTQSLLRVVRGEKVVDPRIHVTPTGRPPRRGVELSQQEVRILRLVAHGLSNRAIGERMYLSRHTVKEYLSSAMRKLDVSTRVEAALEARRRNLLDSG